LSARVRLVSIRIKGAQLSGWQVWACCVGGLLLFDPLNVLSESFWLSALAVAMLLSWYHWFPLPARCRRGLRWLQSLGLIERLKMKRRVAGALGTWRWKAPITTFVQLEQQWR